MGKWLVVLSLIMIEPANRCEDVPIEGATSIDCSIQQVSHGWKLWLKMGYTGGRRWERLEKPKDREFWRTDAEAFARCSEWRACVTSRILAHKEEQRRNKHE